MIKVFEKLSNLLFPSYLKCIVCGRELEEKKATSVCVECLKELPYITQPCMVCGEQLFSLAQKCIACKSSQHHFVKASSVFVYDGAVKKLIYQFKYGNAKYLAKYLAVFLCELYAKQDFTPDIVVSVPLCKTRLKERDYNQADLLGQILAKTFHLAYDASALMRIKETTTQAGLSREERAKNLQDAFLAESKTYKGKTVLLIDDVFTTGATADAVSLALLKAKAKAVYVLTLAHTTLQATE